MATYTPTYTTNYGDNSDTYTSTYTPAYGGGPPGDVATGAIATGTANDPVVVVAIVVHPDTASGIAVANGAALDISSAEPGPPAVAIAETATGAGHAVDGHLAVTVRPATASCYGSAPLAQVSVLSRLQHLHAGVPVRVANFRATQVRVFIFAQADEQQMHTSAAP